MSSSAMESLSEDADAPCPFAWSNLPEEVLQLVLERVPFPSLIRLREVCRKWNSLIISPQFTRKCQRQQALKSVPVLVPCCFADNAEWAIYPYSSESNSWQPLSLTFLQTASASGVLHLTASSGGLMCFESEDCQGYIVCNPITKRWRHLQIPDTYVAESGSGPSSQGPTHRHTVTGLVVDRGTGNYKLVVASLMDESKQATLVYDSSMSKWRKGAKVPVGKQFLKGVTLTFNGKLYCVVKDTAVLEEQGCPCRILRYDVAEDIWSELSLDTGLWKDDTASDLELVEYRDHVSLVSRVLIQRWMAKNCFDRLWYVTFYKVVESPGGPEMALEQEKRIVNRLDKSTGFMTIVTSSFAEQDDRIDVTGVPFTSNDDDDDFPLLRINILVMNPTTQSHKFSNMPTVLQMEMRLLEPSLTAAV